MLEEFSLLVPQIVLEDIDFDRNRCWFHLFQVIGDKEQKLQCFRLVFFFPKGRMP